MNEGQGGGIFSPCPISGVRSTDMRHVLPPNCPPDHLRIRFLIWPLNRSEICSDAMDGQGDTRYRAEQDLRRADLAGG